MIQKIQNARKNNKAFSLVELIIVIAIMVALIAVMAPQFLKYVQKSRDSAIAQAAEDYFSAIKVGYSDPDNALTGEGDVYIWVDSDGKLQIKKTDKAGSTDTIELTKLNAAAGVSAGKSMGKTTIAYKITITKATLGGYDFVMSSVDTSANEPAFTTPSAA